MNITLRENWTLPMDFAVAAKKLNIKTVTDEHHTAAG